MKRNLYYITFVFLLIVVSSAYAGDNMQCTIETTGDCSGESQIVKLTGETNSHGGDLGQSYSHVLCCIGPNAVDVDFTTTNTGSEEYVFSMLAASNSEFMPLGEFQSGTDIDYYLTTDEGYLECSNKTTDCAADELCMIGFMPSGNFYHMAECSEIGPTDRKVCCKMFNSVEISGTVLEESQSGGTKRSNGAIVEVRRNSDHELLASTNTVTGDYTLTLNIPFGEAFEVVFKKASYSVQTHGPYPCTDDNPITKDTTLELTSECEPDCTRGDNFCHAECDGINGCSFDPVIKPICDGQGVGWLKDYDATNDVECCNAFVPKTTNTVDSMNNVSVTKSVKNIVTYSPKTVIRRGKPVELVVSMWEY